MGFIRNKLPILAIIILVSILYPGCRFDYPFEAWERELDEMWPHENGYNWSYDYTFKQAQYYCVIHIYPDIEEIPDFPTFEEIEARLDDDQFPGDHWIFRGTYELLFDGMIRTESGAEGQNLVPTASFPEYNHPIEAGEEDMSRSFLERLVLYRPDLREKIISMGYLGEDEIPETILHKVAGPSLVPDIEYLPYSPIPLFLHGGAWEITEDHIGLYGDIDRLLAWKFLERDLSVGHEFKHQLVPSLADDVFLHCKILQRRIAGTATGIFDNALVCLYAIDYGIAVVHTLNPLDDDYYRIFDYGTVTYVPGIGPVECCERLLNDVSPGSLCCVERILDIEWMAKR